MTERIAEYLRETAATAERSIEACSDDIAGAADVISRSLRDGGKVLFCGNGGSAGDAQHLATEFVSTLTLDRRRPAIPAIALTTDTSLLTAVANDFGFEEIFARQVEAVGRAGDVLVGISTSGDSRNVVRAFEQAASLGVSRVSLTGRRGGALAPAADLAIRVPSDETSHIQELHIAIGQLIAFLVEDELHPQA
jgi:D-sedoheptulose 7-phosphate isomerase